MSNGTTKIESLSDFLKEIAKIERETVYRGQSDEGWEVTSGAYRRLETSGILPHSSKLLKYNTELIDKAHRHAKELSEQITDLALLAKLQHYGAATSLIDFTRSASIALWFACQDSQTDGKVFCLDISDPSTFLEVSPTDEEEDLKTILTLKFRDKDSNRPAGNLTGGELWKGDKIAKWEPPIDNRTLKQDSFFIFNTTGKLDKFIKELTISKDKKEQILKELNQLSALSEETVFPDFYGFSQNNAVNKPHGPQDDEEYFLHGNANLTSGKYPEAINDYDQAIELNPEHTDAYNNRGIAKCTLKDYTGAIEDYGRAIELNPRHADAYNSRGNAKYDLGYYKEAIADYDKAIALNPQDALAYNNRGNAKSALGYYKEAITDYDKAIELNSQYVNAYNGRGAANFALKNYEAAIEDCNQAIELNPKYANAYNGRGNVKSALGNHGEAIEDFVKAKELYTLQGNMAMASECAEIIVELEKLINNNGQN